MSYIDVQDELLEYSVPSQGLLQSEANNTVVDRLGKHGPGGKASLE